MKALRLASIVSALTLSNMPFVVSSCSDSTDPTNTPSAKGDEYHGVLTTPGETGVVAITMGGGARPSSLRPLANDGQTVSGSISLVLGGEKVVLSGTYDSATGRLTLTGTTPRGTYTLEGTRTDDGFIGTVSAPSGTGTFTLSAGGAGAVAIYCGSYEGGSRGSWNLVVGRDNVVTGAQCDASGCGTLMGKVEGARVTLRDPKKPDVTANGTVTGDDVTGTWQSSSTSGTWSGSKRACQGTTGEVTKDDAGSDAAAPAVREVLASGLSDIVSLSIDATHVYFLSGADATIARCPLAGCGGNAPEVVVGKLSVPSSVAVAGGKAFWTNGYTSIVSCSLASLPCTGATFSSRGDGSYPAHLWVDNDRVYWIRQSSATRLIETCPLSGCTGEPHVVYTSKSGDGIHDQALAGLAITSTHAYLSRFTGGLVRLSMIDAENANANSATALKESGFGTGNVDSDGTLLRWAVQGDGKVYSCAAPDCATVSEFITDQQEVGGTRSDATHVYGFNRGTPNGGSHVQGTSVVWRLAK